ncbi:MAG: OmpA family protein [Thermodesulfovibrionales bacterium]
MRDEIAALDDDVLDFNFWPSFADLMLALVLILILVLFSYLIVISVGTVNLTHVKNNQMEMVQGIANAYGVNLLETNPNQFVISTGIIIQNEPVLQKISFTDNILFPPDETILSKTGIKTLTIVGKLLKERLPVIQEIQIQGHADTDKSRLYPSNLDLAALRAIEVFKFLQNEIGIDPSEHLMSATSFGEFKPVQRSDENLSYNYSQLTKDNSTKSLKDKNRRIELLLFYKIS